MDFSKIKDYLNLMKSLKVKALGLLGGEPTLHPNIFDIIRLAKEKEFVVTLYTNGRKLSDESFVKMLKKSGVDFVNFSIQSGKKHYKEHDKTVGFAGAWKETKKGIENCFKNNIKVNIQAVLSHSNLKIYKEMIDEFRRANLFIYYRHIPKIMLNDKFFKQKVMSNKKTKNIYKKIYVYAKRRDVRTYLFSRMPLCWWNKKDCIEKEIHKKIVSCCHILNGSVMSIDINGKILSCPQYIDLHTMNLIKNNKVISKKEFISYYNHGLPKQVREELRYVPDNKCLRCSYFGKKCSGGCPLVKFEIGPYVDKLPN